MTISEADDTTERMLEVRAIDPRDLEPLVQLYRGCFPAVRARQVEEVERKLRKLFFDGPFVSAEVPSLVACDATGAIVGFRGWLLRRWRLGEERLRARTENSRMVRSDMRRRGVSSAIQAYGRQIIARLGSDMFAVGGDAATGDGLRFNAGTRGGAMNLFPLAQYGFAWEIARSPLRLEATRRIAGRLGLARLGGERAAQLMAALLPRERRELPHAAPLRSAPLSTDALIECREALTADYSLGLDEDPETTRWLLDYLADYPSRGRFDGRVLMSESGDPVGFFAAYPRDDRSFEVLGFAALQAHLPGAIAGMLHAAATHGAQRATGRATGRQLRCFIASGAVVGAGLPMRVNTPRSDIRLQFESMQALYTGLECERWT